MPCATFRRNKVPRGPTRGLSALPIEHTGEDHPHRGPLRDAARCAECNRVPALVDRRRFGPCRDKRSRPPRDRAGDVRDRPGRDRLSGQGGYPARLGDPKHRGGFRGREDPSRDWRLEHLRDGRRPPPGARVDTRYLSSRVVVTRHGVGPSNRGHADGGADQLSGTRHSASEPRPVGRKPKLNVPPSRSARAARFARPRPMGPVPQSGPVPSSETRSVTASSSTAT